MPTQSFAQQVVDVDRRVREIHPALAAQIQHDPGADATATWSYRDYRALLTHHHGPPEWLQLTLLGTAQPRDAMEIAPDDADVIELIAKPIAGLFAGEPG